jgi:hypothetical protein
MISYLNARTGVLNINAFYKACFLKTKQIHEDISYLNARTAGVLTMRLYKTCFSKTKQTHEVISYLNARTGVLNINAFILSVFLKNEANS